MSEGEIQLLISGKRVPFSMKIPKPLMDRTLAAARKKFGAIPERNLKALGVFYFLARGIVDWEKDSKRG